MRKEPLKVQALVLTLAANNICVEAHLSGGYFQEGIMSEKHFTLSLIIFKIKKKQKTVF